MLKHFLKSCIKSKILITIVIGIFPSVALAAPDITTILINLRHLLGPLITLLLIISYAAGIFMIIRALSLLRNFGSSQARPGEMVGPLVYILVGAVLIYLPSTTDVMSRTIFGTNMTTVVTGGNINLAAQGRASNVILNYSPTTIEDQWADIVDTVVLYMQFIGFLAFVRGWFIISHAGQPGAQPGNIPKGLTHIIGGIIAVNFMPMINALSNTVFGG